MAAWPQRVPWPMVCPAWARWDARAGCVRRAKWPGLQCIKNKQSRFCENSAYGFVWVLWGAFFCHVVLSMSGATSNLVLHLRKQVYGHGDSAKCVQSACVVHLRVHCVDRPQRLSHRPPMGLHIVCGYTGPGNQPALNSCPVSSTYAIVRGRACPTRPNADAT